MTVRVGSGCEPPPRPCEDAGSGFRLPPSHPQAHGDDCALDAAFRDTRTFLAANRLFMGETFGAAAVEPGGRWALEEGVDVGGAFLAYLDRPGVTALHPSPEDAARAFAEEELDLSPEAARRFAEDLMTLVRRSAGGVADEATRATRRS
ncbi:hypothetical protein ACTZWW_16255 [Salinarimonas sp. NSM]|uniref:hypothetical protein n=1 Tax=Salinarimonas sp. NSM TaxID=3458003 RepID=UPI00403559F9